MAKVEIYTGMLCGYCSAILYSKVKHVFCIFLSTKMLTSNMLLKQKNDKVQFSEIQLRNGTFGVICDETLIGQSLSSVTNDSPV